MKQVSFRAHHPSSAVKTLFGRGSLKIRHLRVELITVVSLMTCWPKRQEPHWRGTGEDRQVYFHCLGLCGVVLTIDCGQLAVG